MKKIFVSLLFLLILTGCSSNKKDEEKKIVPYKEIVNNELKIVNMDKEEIYLSEYKLSFDKDFLIEATMIKNKNQQLNAETTSIARHSKELQEKQKIKQIIFFILFTLLFTTYSL